MAWPVTYRPSRMAEREKIANIGKFNSRVIIIVFFFLAFVKKKKKKILG